MHRRATPQRTLSSRTHQPATVSPQTGAASPAAPVDRPRESSTQRGYGYRWQKYSAQYRRENPLCVMCLPNVITPAACVDHIKPVTSADDPDFWNPANHQALCWTCHSVKTQTEDRGKGRVEK